MKTIGILFSGIANIDELKCFKGMEITILIETDNINRYARISIGNLIIHEGFLWEFRPGICIGWFYDLALRYGGFSNVKTLTTSLHKALSDFGAICEIEERAFKSPLRDTLS